MNAPSQRHQYEVEFTYPGPMFHAGNSEKTAVATAVKLMAENGYQQCRLYHSYPSPGPVRRYVGTVTAEGKLQRAA